MNKNQPQSNKRKGFLCDIETINASGNTLVHPNENQFFVLNAKNIVISEGSHLAPLWDQAIRNGAAVKPITLAEKEAIQSRFGTNKKKQGVKHYKMKFKKITHVQVPTIDVKVYLRMLGVREPVEVRKKQPEAVVAYMDPEYLRDRRYPRGIATK